jgi:hypothetical protein
LAPSRCSSATTTSAGLKLRASIIWSTLPTARRHNKCGPQDHFTRFSGHRNYQQRSGTRPYHVIRGNVENSGIRDGVRGPCWHRARAAPECRQR